MDTTFKWLQTCLEDHKGCRSTHDGALPTRLIAVGGGSLRLILSSDCSERPQYAALSHCWGDHKVLELTQTKLDVFMAGLPAEELPTTFKDAIEITRGLGIDYLWIDSLCIIQSTYIALYIPACHALKKAEL